MKGGLSFATQEEGSRYTYGDAGRRHAMRGQGIPFRRQSWENVRH